MRRAILFWVVFALCFTWPVDWLIEEAESQTPPPTSGDWDINDNTTISNTQILLQGDLNVFGNLTLDNVDLYMYGTSNGHRSIMVNNSAHLKLINGTQILPYIATYYWNFDVNSGGRITTNDVYMSKVDTVSIITPLYSLNHLSINNSNSDGLYLDDANSQSFAENITIQNSGSDGMELELTTSSLKLRGVTILDSSNHGITYPNSNKNLEIIESTIEGSSGTYQIYSNSDANLTLRNSTVSNASGINKYGIYHLPTSNAYSLLLDNATVENNSVYSSVDSGNIAGVYGKNVTIINSVISRNYDLGAYTAGGLENVKMKCYGVYADKLSMDNSVVSQNCRRVFEGNRSTYNNWAGSSNCVVTTNGGISSVTSYCFGFSAHGIFSSQTMSITNSTISDNSAISVFDNCYETLQGSSSPDYNCYYIYGGCSGCHHYRNAMAYNYGLLSEGRLIISDSTVENNSRGYSASRSNQYYTANVGMVVTNKNIILVNGNTSSTSYINNTNVSGFTCNTSGGTTALGCTNLYIGDSRSVYAVNSTFDNSEIVDAGGLYRQWYIDVNVYDYDNQPSNDTPLSLRESNNFIVDTGTTDSNGNHRFIAKEYYKDVNTTVTYTPHTVTSTKSGYTNSSSVNLSSGTTGNLRANQVVSLLDNVPDAFPGDPTQDTDTDGDGYGDNISGNNPDHFVSNPTQWNDTDSDGYGDNWAATNWSWRNSSWPGQWFPNATQVDRFPTDATQWNDSDEDGYGDNWANTSWNSTRNSSWPGEWVANATEPDSCPLQWGNSSANSTTGCPDTDGDGWANQQDAFSAEDTQWSDSDSDGYGDNWGNASWNATRNSSWSGQWVPNAYQQDGCPTVAGNSTIDLFGCIDNDGDGWSNLTDDCPDSFGNSTANGTYGCPDTDGDGWADLEDAFTNDSSQWADGDNDGYGENQNGTTPDACPTTWGNSTANGTYGCPDTDGDGWADSEDDLIDDPTQWLDTDGDGYGDNQSGNNPDAFINDATQWNDTDGDGYGDNQSGNNPDAFINDSTQWLDTDGDGYGDNQSGNNPDAFTNDSTQWNDTDGDGYGDNANGNNPDAFINDSTQWADSDGDGYGDNASGTNGDAFPNDVTQWQDSDGDGYGDNASGNNPDEFPNDSTQWADSDGDGYGDNASGTNGDDFANDSTQWNDTDNDGFGDNWANSSWNATRASGGIGQWFANATTPDSCPTTAGNSSANSTFGCPDTDGDGWANNQDSFTNDQTQWSDYDSDGYGDNWNNVSWNSSRNSSWPGQWLANATTPDSCPMQWGNSTSDRYGCTDTDGDGVSDLNDAFPNDPLRSGDTDNDGYDDSWEDDCWGVWGNSSADRQGCPDSDGDGYSNPDSNWTITDGADAFQTTPSQWNDTDNDGFGDNLSGYQGDDCLTTSGNSTANGTYGCPDTDGDTWADSDDVFPNDSSQWADSDADGYGDSATGTLPDACPSTWGNSTLDRFGCADTDGDAYSDAGDTCPFNAGTSTANNTVGCPDADGDTWADSQDAFPSEVTQWADTDGDGFGDNASGFQPDTCPSLAGNSTFDRFGCPDQDGDGWSDINDEFVYEPSQWNDTDDDGYGDNATGYQADDCPSVWGNSSVDLLGCPDVDGDGVSDTGDHFPNDGTRTTDLDGDGFDDDWEDDCPTIWGTSTEDLVGCRDTDGDGWSDSGDAFPTEGTQWSDSDLDGYGDNNASLAFQPDACPTTAGNSTLDRYGCLDGDGDGYSDPDANSQAHPFGSADAFLNDSTQWHDTDADGFGDNPAGNNPDSCPSEYGTSTGDRYGCPDGDGDGISDANDAFPTDPFRSGDNDGDGLDDALEDDCPTAWGNSTEDRFGCLDSDGDGRSDPTTNWNSTDGADAFPLDATQWADSDLDGYGENLNGTTPDSCPFAFGNSTANETLGCPDTDGDGWADSQDIFDDEPTQWGDYDGDGYGDNWANESWNESRISYTLGIWVEGAFQPDKCPTFAGNSTIDVLGCYDEDGDGYSVFVDTCPRSLPGSVVNETGCADDQIDSDSDGVYDYEDLCPGQSDNIDVDNDGIPDCNDDFIDSDSDGVVDAVDICPNTSADADSVDVLGCSPSQVDTDRDGEPDIDDLDDDNDAIVDSFDDEPLIPDPLHLHEFTIEIDDGDVTLNIVYKVDAGTATAYASLADFMTHLGLQPDGSLDSQEQDSFEEAMCESPSMYYPVTFEGLAANITIEGYSLTLGEIQCEWEEKGIRAAGEIRSETLMVKIPFQSNASVDTSFAFSMNGEGIPRTCLVSLEYGSKTMEDEKIWWPWFENYTFSPSQEEEITDDNPINNNDDSSSTDNETIAETGGMSDSSATIFGATCLFILIGLVMIGALRRSSKKNEELQLQLALLSQTQLSKPQPPLPVMASVQQITPPTPETIGVMQQDGVEWLEQEGVNWYRYDGQYTPWHRYE